MIEVNGEHLDNIFEAEITTRAWTPISSLWVLPLGHAAPGASGIPWVGCEHRRALT
jgi:hypothetical protein